MRAVIYLDVNGVLLTGDSWSVPPDRVKILNGLTDSVGAEIVLSSTWRLGGPAKLAANIARFGIANISGCTPVQPEDKAKAIIADWEARGHPPMVVIDDYGRLEVPNLVVCDPKFGLTKQSVAQALSILRRGVRNRAEGV